MIEVPRPEQPAGGTPPTGRRSSAARRRARVRRKARLRVGASATLAVIVAGGAVMATAGPAMAAGSSTKTKQPAASKELSVTGTLESVGKNSLAFKLADDTVATATLSSSTLITKTENLKPSALKNGKSVTVTGTTTNGVLTASRIVVTQTAFRPGAGGFRPGAGAARGSLPEGFRPRAGGEGFRPGEGFRSGEGFRPGEGFGPGGNITFGTISGLSGGSFTLTEFNKDKVKVTTTASTVVTETVRTNKKGLTVGQELLVRGKEINNTKVAAASISQGNGGLGFFGRGGGGPGAGGPGAGGPTGQVTPPGSGTAPTT
jgi:hypothetical protein